MDHVLHEMGREPQLVHVDEFHAAAKMLYDSNDGWPWQIVGVFPRADEHDGMPGEWWNAFAYTSGLGTPELWMPCASIEGRLASFELIATVLNALASAWLLSLLNFNDTVIVPLGKPGGPDVDGMFWVGHDPEPAWQRQCFQTESIACLPILWSSPLGWPDE